MYKRIPIGLKDYRKMKSEHYYTVDKSLMIQTFLEYGYEVTLITRPRRFGKTINLSMMAEFFDITKDSREIFEDTKIAKTKYISKLNQYPTIFVSFANAKNNKVSVVQDIKLQLSKEYDRYSHVFEDKMRIFEQNDYDMIVQGLLQVNDGNLSSITNALSFLMEKIERYYHKKVMVFIDEYDTPFIEAHVGGFYDDIDCDLSLLLHSALKTSTSLQHAMLCGSQRVIIGNIFGGLNNIVVCTVKDREYAQYFGFSEEETKTVLEYYGLILNDEVKSMYGGYRFGDEELYNPWSVLNYAYRKELGFDWDHRKSDTLIKKVIAFNKNAFRRGCEQLMQTGKLETTVNMDTCFFEMQSASSLWGLLVNEGYLTIDSLISLRDCYYVIKVANQEAQLQFQELASFD